MTDIYALAALWLGLALAATLLSIWLRIATSVLTVLSAWRLRATQPDLPRAFRIPWGKTGLAYAVIAPLLMSGVAMIASDKFALHWGPVVLLLGPLAYFLLRWTRKNQETQSSNL